VKLRTTTLIEVAIKDCLLIWLAGWGFFPMVLRSQEKFPPHLQGSVLSMTGLLMAAAIVGAFELSYSRTPLGVSYIRYRAHAPKFLLYSAIVLLMTIAMGWVQRLASSTTPLRSREFWF